MLKRKSQGGKMTKRVFFPEFLWLLSFIRLVDMIIGIVFGWTCFGLCNCTLDKMGEESRNWRKAEQTMDWNEQCFDSFSPCSVLHYPNLGFLPPCYLAISSSAPLLVFTVLSDCFMHALSVPFGIYVKL